MADVRPSVTQKSLVAASLTRVPRREHVDRFQPIEASPFAPEALPRDIFPQIETTTSLTTDFVAPSTTVRARLGSPRLVAALEAASQALAPDGVSRDAADRYAASVIETHLSAQRRLTKMTNALLKT